VSVDGGEVTEKGRKKGRGSAKGGRAVTKNGMKYKERGSRQVDISCGGKDEMVGPFQVGTGERVGTEAAPRRNAKVKVRNARKIQRRFFFPTD